jgi:hypothetical protein
MFDPDELPRIRRLIREQTAADSTLLDRVLREAERLRGRHVVIQPRSTTSVSLVASDGGNNRVEFNPFYLQMVRVVDSYGVEQFLDVVSPTTNTDDLSRRHLDQGTALGKMMTALGVTRLNQLSPMLPAEPRSASWPLTYRDICEWAVLHELICETTFTTETLIVRDGLLRTKIFADGKFVELYELLKQAIERTKRERRRDVFLVGIAKHSSVLSRYELALTISDLLPAGTPLYAPVPQEMQDEVYVWSEYTRPPDDASVGERPKFNMGSMYFVRFGGRSGDPVWTIDVLYHQTDQAQKIFGSLLADAIAGFPIPFYPLCLQRADHFAQVVDLDLQIMKDTMIDAIRAQLPTSRRPAFDGLQMATDVTGRRYE